MVGESRTELLNWLNTELNLNYSKVEQCGSGAAYCQLMDSIFGGVPMSKVKFNTKSEYDYRGNMKILQAAFNKHGITKPIEVEKLIKCRLQDNLELLQWFKRFWSENKDVHSNYDPSSRRNSTTPSSRVVSGSSGSIRSRPSSRTASGSQPSISTSKSLPKQRELTSRNTPASHSSNGSIGSLSHLSSNTIRQGYSVHEYDEKCRQLQLATEELDEYKIQLESMETERNFYYNKLIEIEQMVRNINADKIDTSVLSVKELATQIQDILYTTEEGFQITEDIDLDAETF